MIEKLINDIEKFYKKRVVFNTLFSTINEKTKTFKISAEEAGGYVHILTARINEHDDKVEVIKVDLVSVVAADFYKMNERNDT